MECGNGRVCLYEERKQKVAIFQACADDQLVLVAGISARQIDDK